MFAQTIHGIRAEYDDQEMGSNRSLIFSKILFKSIRIEHKVQ